MKLEISSIAGIAGFVQTGHQAQESPNRSAGEVIGYSLPRSSPTDPFHSRICSQALESQNRSAVQPTGFSFGNPKLAL
ncbi:16455_t:CDS:2, partial [Rhizophagus irregularis]